MIRRPKAAPSESSSGFNSRPGSFIPTSASPPGRQADSSRRSTRNTMAWSWPVIAVVCFTIGFAAGFAAAESFNGAPRRRLKLNIALLIAAVWALSIVSGIFVDGYSTSIALHAIMGAIVGYLYKDVEENPVTEALTGGNDKK